MKKMGLLIMSFCRGNHAVPPAVKKFTGSNATSQALFCLKYSNKSIPELIAQAQVILILMIA